MFLTLAQHSDEQVALLVFENPSLLAQYFKMLSKGFSPIEIADEFSQEFVKANRLYKAHLQQLRNQAQNRGYPLKPINVGEFKTGLKGKPFYLLIQYHLKRQRKATKHKEAAIETIALLPEAAWNLCTGFIDRWNERAYDQSFWTRDSSEIFSEITEDARSMLSSVGITADDEALFNMFQIVVLTYAYTAADQPNMRKFIGIR